ncbi:acyl-CoA dehydrogenase family protein [Natronoglycomyces albus]|uniref:Acyl-CoA dehydrogenase family protein n=1 Tax=Natronoglycomyces albus TaxID=2811108 RepID=A0A895XGM9_9ACTN|nr:acyl-CoA dehydrogenase family protein [Natronoglycomyces albus]QSB05011.1 acyl-CoA dehydrogenase family protein [Natronoglycomyces albus]
MTNSDSGRGHNVVNQPPPLTGRDLLADNLPLSEALEWSGSGWAASRAHQLGTILGSAEAARNADEAHRDPPRLRTHDRYGHRLDEVEFNPAWHYFMDIAVSHGLHALPWSKPTEGAHAARAAQFLLAAQVEPGHGCPISMTYASIPTLRANRDLAKEWEPVITSNTYEPQLRPVAQKHGALIGMAMTEKQGGSDVRANTTFAQRDGEAWRLTGHKWFCSAPMNDAFLVLAQAPGGLSCFLLPRVLPDGAKNAMQLLRLKDKLGNRSNASAEVEFDDAWAQLVGEEGRGVRTIIEMVNHTRLDCVIASAAGMRQSVAEATWHAAHRSAFGHRLIDQPLMASVLADLSVESEAATFTAMRLAAAYDDPNQQAFRRLATAVSKYWVCKRGPAHAAEALECLGGNGYVEEAPLARRYREQPLMSIWEGSGNVMCLDVLRALVTAPETADAFLDEVTQALGANKFLDAHLVGLGERMRRPEMSQARRLSEDLALALQASLLVRYSPAPVADAFCASRLGPQRGLNYGDLPPGLSPELIVQRHQPPV